MSQATLLVFPDNERWKNVFSFDHAMAHRYIMSMMGPLNQWSAMPYFIDPMHYDDDPSGPWHFAHQQAHDDFNSYLPPHPNADPPPGMIFQGPIASVHLVSGGTGFTSAPTFTVHSAFGSGASFHYTIGPAPTYAITSLSVVSGGQGYGSTDTLTIGGPGTGASATISISSVNISPASSTLFGTGIVGADILVDTDLERQDSQPWWTFANHQDHLTAINAISFNRQVATDQQPWWALDPRQVQTFW